MIEGFRHRGLKRLYERGDPSRVPAGRLARIEDVLSRLDIAEGPSDMDLPGYGLQGLTGDLKGYWSVSVSRNWRIVFRFAGDQVTDVDLIDYHRRRNVCRCTTRRTPDA